ncbi:type IV secretory system conjugative DNA transfer family protein [Pedobacter frigiditerrae]|uniref:type IV secretory system conjugative DNA transfer family protein n=1 Tax=Pedobacter frigiditerrae TaxID=2530452 RepID=UPI001CED2D56|nr:type IV secretory system conjugative DNA transfer family protein [Pedobacter frigiditerrae]
MYEYHPFTPIARTNWRNRDQLFGIKQLDRLQHIYCLGKTGTGKSTLLVNMALDDIYKGNGICVIDPHADTVNTLIKKIPEHRKEDVVYFDATNLDTPPTFNPLYNVPEHQRQLVASEMVLTLKKIFHENWGNKLEYILRFSILTLLDYPDATLLDIHALLVDKEFRSMILKYVKNPYTHSFWATEYNAYTPSVQASQIMPILNKIGIFLANDTLRVIMGGHKSISIEQCMNDNKILLCNLSKGEIGEDISTILGSFLTTCIQTNAMRRAEKPLNERMQFYLYIDEAHSFLSSSFATMLSEVRKYGVGLFLTHQHLEQLEDGVRSAVLGNVGTIICFRLGLKDAKVMEREFYPTFNHEDFINLPRYNIYIKLLIDGTSSKGFSAITHLEN